MAKYRILALDGGGLRGVLTAVIMGRLDKEIRGWRTSLDLIAGTSTGGVLALALGRGMQPEDLVNFYRTNGPTIFNESLLDKVKDVGRLIGAPYKSAPLEGVLKALFGDNLTLNQLKPIIVVPSFNLDDTYEFDDGIGKRTIDTWKPKVFHNDSSLGTDENDGRELAYQVAMRTSAAPTYFPSYGTYIDGGVFANNPSMVALAQALHSKADNHPELNDIALLNLGTGVHESVITGNNHDWGDAQWATNIVDLVLDGAMDVAKFECLQLLGTDRYYRLSPYLGQKIPMDAPSTIDTLIDIGKSVDLGRVVQWMRHAGWQ